VEVAGTAGNKVARLYFCVGKVGVCVIFSGLDKVAGDACAVEAATATGATLSVAAVAVVDEAATPVDMGVVAVAGAENGDTVAVAPND